DVEIELNGLSVRALSPASMAKHIAYHGQDNFLVPGTILENLLLENPGCSAERAIALAEKLGAGISEKFSGGYDHQIIESGKNLSGGEKQIICLVRTLLRSAEIFILDEFTNHLSAEIVQKVTRYLNSEEMAGRTLLVVSHQPISLRGRELRFERGRLQVELLR
ncbi:MAG: ATP-binding cassette domain-containing protein, partial [Hymenobacter sp.]